jgi:hypothetical protein
VTYPGGDPLEGLDATPEERLAFYEALGEEALEAPGGYPGAGAPAADKLAYYEARAADDDDEWAAATGGDPGGDDDEPEGPWRDQLAALGAIGDQVDDHVTRAAVTAAEDSEDAAWYTTRPSAEDRAARALDRIGAGTYTTPEYFRGDPAAAAAAARDPLGRYAAACGPLDDFARCSARFHTPACHTSIESAAARGSYEEAVAWNEAVAGHSQPPGVLGLANEPQPGDGTDVWADLLETGEPGVAAPGLHARMMNYLGEADASAPPPREGPDAAAIREALGI